MHGLTTFSFPFGGPTGLFSGVNCWLGCGFKHFLGKMNPFWLIFFGVHLKNLVTWENQPWKIIPKDVGFLLFFRVVSGDYGKPCFSDGLKTLTRFVLGRLTSEIYNGTATEHPWCAVNCRPVMAMLCLVLYAVFESSVEDSRYATNDQTNDQKRMVG